MRVTHALAGCVSTLRRQGPPALVLERARGIAWAWTASGVDACVACAGRVVAQREEGGSIFGLGRRGPRVGCEDVRGEHFDGRLKKIGVRENSLA